MIETRIPPTTGRVARTTICPKLTIMSIPRSVTGKTIRRCALIDTVCMAVTTSHVFMLAGQWKAGIIVVEANIPPTAGHMAGTTIRAKLAIMSIPGSMAGITIRRRTLELPVDMAGRTGSVLVLAGQRESRCAVVKSHILPAAGYMTGTAIRAKLPVMGIPGSMAGITIRRCTLELSIRMAGGAGNILVLTPQRESHCTMVKAHVLPAAGHVTGTTICAELPGVRILVCMAGKTVRRRAFELSIGMTGCADDILVLSPQRKTRCAVIEVHVIPTARVMTSGAILAKLPVVRIILLVAGKTIFRRATIAIRMAFFALDVNMLACQLKVGKGVVKDPVTPICGVMARGAIHPKAAFVWIILLMTGKTIGRCPFE
jgi:hypothetical protein